MPGVDGFETCRRFKADPLLAHIPIIFLTALSDTGTEVEGLQLGAADYLHKPLNVQIGRQRIRNLLERDALKRALERQQQELERQVEERTESLRRSNAELLKAKEAAEAANRVKAEFLSNVSHELRTPLNIILGMTEILHRKLQDKDLLQKTLKVEQAGRQLLHIIDDVLYLTRMEGDTHEASWDNTSTADLARDILADFQRDAAVKGLRLRSEIDSDVPQQFLGQASRLTHVLRHLTSNAIKFSDSGEVVLRVSCGQTQGSGQHLIFTVTDQGAGIPPGQVHQLFAAFTQGDGTSTRRHGGLGIGLAICRHLTQLMGGEIRVESEWGRGSSFSVTVPVQFNEVDQAANSTLRDADAAELAPQSPPGAAAERLPAVTDEQRLQLARWIGLLEGNDTDAMSLWQDIMVWIAPFAGDDALLVEQHLEQFAFEEALALLESLLSRFPQLQSPQ